MNLKYLLLRYFLPFIVIYCSLTGLSYWKHTGKLMDGGIRSFVSQLYTSSFDTPYTKLLTSPRKYKEANETWIAYQSPTAIRTAIDKAKAAKQANFEFPTKKFKITNREFILLPLFLLWSLVLVSPISWKRRGLYVLLATISYLAYAAIQLDLVMLLKMSEIGAVDLSSSTISSLKGIIPHLTTGVSITVGIVIWAVLLLPQVKKPTPFLT